MRKESEDEGEDEDEDDETDVVGAGDMPVRIYTKTGDEGDTSLYDGSRAPKDGPRIECVGAFDELNSYLGLARQFVKDDRVKAVLLSVQQRLFALEAELATPPGSKAPHIPIIGEKDVARLERLIDAYIAKIDDVAAFIVPGSSPGAAHLHVARTICRRAERRMVALGRKEPLRPHLLQYVNRLSDLLYALARFCEEQKTYVDYDASEAGNT